MNGDAGNDTMHGGAGNDTMNGGADDDTMYGDTGNDVMSGGTGDDYIEGEAGNDSITGGAGDDRLSGGVGRDTFNFDSRGGADFGNDTIESPVGGRDFSVVNRDTLVFDVDAGFDPSSDVTVVSGDWDGDGDGYDLAIITSAGTVIVEDFWQGADAFTQLLLDAGFFDSVDAMNAYSQGQGTYDMIQFA